MKGPYLGTCAIAYTTRAKNSGVEHPGTQFQLMNPPRRPQDHQLLGGFEEGAQALVGRTHKGTFFAPGQFLIGNLDHIEKAKGYFWATAKPKIPSFFCSGSAWLMQSLSLACGVLEGQVFRGGKRVQSVEGLYQACKGVVQGYLAGI